MAALVASRGKLLPPPEPPGGGAERWLLAKQLAAIAIASSCNLGLNFYNAWALKADGDGPRFAFPIFFTMLHPVAGALGAAIIMGLMPPSSGYPTFAQAWEYRTALLPMCICTFLNVGLNNVSLTMISLFLNQVIKATGPFPTMLLMYVIRGTTYTLFVCATCAALVAGTILAIPMNSRSHTSALGVVFVLVSTFAVSLKPVIMTQLFQGAGGRPKLAPTALFFYDSSLAAVFMLAYWLLNPAERAGSLNYIKHQPMLVLGIEAGGASMAFCFNLASFFVIHLTSPLTATVCGNGVKVLIIMISAFTTAHLDPRNWVGVGIVCASLAAYVYGCQLAKRQPPKPVAPPFERCFSGRTAAAAPKDPEVGHPTEATPLTDAGKVSCCVSGLCCLGLLTA